MFLFALVALIAMIVLIPPVGKKVAELTGTTVDKVKSLAATVAGVAIAALVVTAGIILAGAMPVVGAVLVLAGAGMLVWNVWPLFQSTKLVGG